MPPTRKTTSKATKAKAAAASASKSKKGSGSGRRRASSDDDEDQEQEQEQEEDQEEEDDGHGGAPPDDSDDDENDAQGGDGEDGLTLMPSTLPPIPVGAKNAAKTLGRKECHRRANDIVRLALATEYKRGSLKRTDIIEKILGKEHARVFPFVFNRACKTLRKSFGYELVELRARGTENEQLRAQAMGQQSQAQEEEEEEEEEGTSSAKGKKAASAAAKKRKRNSNGNGNGEEEGDGDESVSKTKASSGGSGTSSYILRSLLPPALIATISTPSGSLNSVMNPDGDLTDVNGVDLMKDSEGVLVDWKRSDGQLGGMGLLNVVLSLIMVSGRSISNNQLHAYLRRLGLDRKSFLPSSLQPDSQPYDPSRRYSLAQTQSTQTQSSASFGGIGSGGVSGGPLTLDNFLSLLVRQNYLEKVKDTSNQTQGGGGGRGRGRPSNAGEDGEINNVEWKWGSRAEIEIGEQALVGFMGEILKEDDDDDDEDDDEEEEEEEQRTQRGSNGRRKSQQSQRNRLSREEKLEKKRVEREKKLQRDVERAAGSALIV